MRSLCFYVKNLILYAYQFEWAYNNLNYMITLKPHYHVYAKVECIPIICNGKFQVFV
jgi:hypothetical protein